MKNQSSLQVLTNYNLAFKATLALLSALICVVGCTIIVFSTGLKNVTNEVYDNNNGC